MAQLIIRNISISLRDKLTSLCIRQDISLDKKIKNLIEKEVRAVKKQS